MAAGVMSTASDVNTRQERELREIAKAAGPRVRNTVMAVIRDQEEYLAKRFYQVMMLDPMGSAYLNHRIVEERLNTSLQGWLEKLFGLTGSGGEVAAILAYQRHAGETHSRIKLPINLVWRSARYLKHWIWEFLIHSPELTREEVETAVIYVNDMIDLAIEVMNTIFVNNSDRAARTEEAYRLFSLSNDLAAEREKQRAILMEWGMQTMYAAYSDPHPPLQRLSQSDFGLWLTHKAQFMFENSNELEQIARLCEHIDNRTIPGFSNPDTDKQTLLATLEQSLQQIKFLLASLFDRYLEMENGRDVLTKLFSRRFLHSAMMRQINMTKQTIGYSFAVMLVDIDHFKHVNDAHGHDSGDLVLQQIAALVLNGVRAGDFVFRYGGEEILVVLVNVDATIGLSIAEKLRKRIEQEKFMISGDRILQITVSIGVAIHDGHPDAQQMISRADAALYAAKHAGRNRCVLAED